MRPAFLTVGICFSIMARTDVQASTPNTRIEFKKCGAKDMPPWRKAAPKNSWRYKTANDRIQRAKRLGRAISGKAGESDSTQALLVNRPMTTRRAKKVCARAA